MPPTGTATGLFAGRYTLGRVLGEGATAVVYLATDTVGGRTVAVKLLRPELAESTMNGRFLKEIGRTALLQHPRILPVLDSGEQDGRPFFVLPYMEGGTLRQRIRRERQMDVDEAIAITRSVAEALDYAHERGLVHRDVKPENILFSDGAAFLGDFGIARALTNVFGENSTSANMVRGTAAYMSPEQSQASPTLDGRSDVYSLACVFYEMVTGMPAFSGPTAENIIAQRLLHPPRELRVYRPTVPEALDKVVAKALSVVPADRHPTARALVDALEAGSREPANPARVRAIRWPAMVAGGAALVVAAGGLLWLNARPKLDPDRYVVAPFSVRGGTGGLGGEAIATLIYDELRRWPDLRRVDPLRVSALQAKAGYPVTLDHALSLAKAAGAGKLVWGESYRSASSTVVRGVVYDVASGVQHAKDAAVAIGGVADDSIGLRFAALVDTLVASGQPRPPVGAPRRYAAVTEYTAGIAALNGWDLRVAQARFRRALDAEPGYASANLRFAQVSQWLRDPVASWKANAASAAGSGELSARERSHANALVSLAEGDYPAACRQYAALEASDHLDFAASFGSGECRLLDRLVVRDIRSPSGWSFRSSRHEAAEAYLRSFELVPSSFRAYREMIGYRLDRAFITRSGLSRDGYALPDGSGVFWAYPQLVGDSIAFVPYPFEDYTSGRRSVNVTANTAALARARRQLQQLVERWVNLQPNSADAWETQAQALERAGIVSGWGDRSAIGSVRMARRLAETLQDSIRLVRTETRILLKSGQFAAAADVANAALRRWTHADPRYSGALAALAGLVGDRERMETLLDRSAAFDSSFVTLEGKRVSPSPALAALSLRLVAHMVLDGSPDTVRMIEQRIEDHLTAIPVTERAAVRAALTRNAAMLGFPRFGARGVHAQPGGGYLIDLQARLARGDTTAVARELQFLAEQRRAAGVSPGVVSAESAYLEASLHAQTGDSAAAAKRLDELLENLPEQGDLLGVPHRPVSLVAAMALRAAIARQRGEKVLERRWTAAITALRRGR